MSVLRNLAGRIGRRFWVERVSRVVCRAHEEGHIDSWLLHVLLARINDNPHKALGPRPRREGSRG